MFKWLSHIWKSIFICFLLNIAVSPPPRFYLQEKNFEFQKKPELIRFKKSTPYEQQFAKNIMTLVHLHCELDLSPKSHGHILLPMYDYEHMLKSFI